MNKLERKFQRLVADEIKEMFPGCIVKKEDPDYIQGIPDLLILHGDRWATLEVKASEKSPVRPNQQYWVDKMNAMSYSSFIYPENKEEVYNELQSALSPKR